MIDHIAEESVPDWWALCLLGCSSELRRVVKILADERHQLVPIEKNDRAVLLFLGVLSLNDKFSEFLQVLESSERTPLTCAPTVPDIDIGLSELAR